MAAGLPTVAFAEGIRGTTVRDGDHVIVVPAGRGPDHGSARLPARRSARRRAVGNAARELTERSYDWGGIAAGLEDSLVGLARVS